MNKRDIHHHFIPSILKKYVEDLPEWSISRSRSYLKDNSFNEALLSLSNYQLSFKTKDEYLNFCRAVNNELISICKEREFRGLGIIPFPYLEESVREIDYIMNNRLDGVILYTNYDGEYPSTKEHCEIFKRVNMYNGTLFIHPQNTPEIKGKSNSAINPVIEFPLEVTRLYSRFLVEDSLDNFPNINFILGFGGGTLPFLIDRIAKISYAKGMKPRLGRLIVDMLTKRNRALDHLKGVNFDLYTINRPEQMAALTTNFKNEKLLAGTNFPYCANRIQ